MMKKGFTLSEVLITLAAVGVVAAMTIPSIASYASAKTLIEQMKKSQNALSEALRSATVSSGPVANWDWTNLNSGEIMQNNILENLSVGKNCGMGTSDNSCGYKAKTFGSVGDIDLNDARLYKLLLADGTFIGFTKDSSYDSQIKDTCLMNSKELCGLFIVDVNGKNKPNIVGRDIYYYGIYGTNSLSAYGAGILTEDEIDENCSSSGTYAGKTCAAKIAKDGWTFCKPGECKVPYNSI